MDVSILDRQAYDEKGYYRTSQNGGVPYNLPAAIRRAMGDDNDDHSSSSEDPILFSDACGPRKNCTDFCLTLTNALNDSYSIHNCVMLPRIASMYAKGELSAGAERDVNSLGITNLTYPNINNTIGDYGNAFQALPYCLSNYSNSIMDRPGTFGQNPSQWCLHDAHGVERCYKNPCYSYAWLNPDIGGVGVYASLWMQAGILVLLCFFTKMSTSWMFWCIRLPTFVLRIPSGKFVAINWQRTVKDKLWDPLVHTTLDFHKAQCFFMLAMQTASLAVLASSNGMGSNALDQLMNDYFMIAVVAIAGIVPVVTTTFVLHLMDQRSAYLIFLSAASAATSLALLLQLPNGVDPYDVNPTPANVVPQCGQANPERFCSDSDKNLGGQDALDDLKQCVIAGWSVLGLLIIDIIVHSIDRFSRWLYRDHAGSRSPQRSRKARIWIKVGLVCFWGLFLFILIMWLWMISLIFILLARVKDQAALNWRDWSFGQVVSISVYLPVLFDLAALLIFGVEGGMRYRLSRTWKLVRVNSRSVADLRYNQRSIVSEFFQHPLMFITNSGLMDEDEADRDYQDIPFARLHSGTFTTTAYGDEIRTG